MLTRPKRDIGGFQIAMENAALVGVMHRTSDFGEQTRVFCIGSFWF